VGCARPVGCVKKKNGPELCWAGDSHGGQRPEKGEETEVGCGFRNKRRGEVGC
jgi:hypothetical protein